MRKKPEEVFTPKAPHVNPEIYVHRQALEASLAKALRIPKHIFVHGESGSGKTWLYKKVLSEKYVPYFVLNASMISSADSVSHAITNYIKTLEPVRCAGYTEKKEAKIATPILGGGIDHTNQYVIDEEPFLRLLKVINKISEKRQSFLVIDNLEHILDKPKIVSDIASLILYLDDEHYSKHNVRLMLVGTPANIREYISKVKEPQTIINRTQEVPEVSILDDKQALELIQRGFFEILKYDIIDDTSQDFNKHEFVHDVAYFTANIPQFIHELCLSVAFYAEDSNCTITTDGFSSGIIDWLRSSLVSERAIIESRINSRDTKIGRKNQILYTISQMSAPEFSYQEVESALREKFPTSTADKALNVSGILSELSIGDKQVLRKTPNGTHYRFVDPKLRIMTRFMLKKAEDETLKLRKFDESLKLF